MKKKCWMIVFSIVIGLERYSLRMIEIGIKEIDFYW